MRPGETIDAIGYGKARIPFHARVAAHEVPFEVLSVIAGTMKWILPKPHGPQHLQSGDAVEAE